MSDEVYNPWQLYSTGEYRDECERINRELDIAFNAYTIYIVGEVGNGKTIPAAINSARNAIMLPVMSQLRGYGALDSEPRAWLASKTGTFITQRYGVSYNGYE